MGNAYLTSSLLRTPFATNASLGCKYLWKVRRMTVSAFTLIPSCSSIALMFVPYFYSPPSLIKIRALPPSSMYLLMSCNSYALKGSLGAPKRSRSASLSFFRVRSALFISHYTYYQLIVRQSRIFPNSSPFSFEVPKIEFPLTLYLVLSFWTIFL